MKIKLNEIPENGRDYILNRKTGELNDVLQDLIQTTPYDLKFSIRPLNSKDYELKGTLETHTQELCSLCGDTFKFNLNVKINEILIESAGADKDLEKQSRSNHFSELNENGPSVIEYNEDTFELGEFAHESAAINIPFNPKCESCLKTDTGKLFKYDEDMGNFEKAKEKENPFNVLKGIKIN
ncbi:MAG: DUF177 domain-containing protein [Bdellovibrionaceae bacterium]|nr:DUF177 domain-containing protein [Pseudobdellovibrionaceae bacterium]